MKVFVFAFMALGLAFGQEAIAKTCYKDRAEKVVEVRELDFLLFAQFKRGGGSGRFQTDRFDVKLVKPSKGEFLSQGIDEARWKMALIKDELAEAICERAPGCEAKLFGQHLSFDNGRTYASAVSHMLCLKTN